MYNKKTHVAVSQAGPVISKMRTSLLFALVFLLGFTSALHAADQITLNLKDADIRALISTVSKFTGKNFIIDPRVKAKVTVVSANTMSPEEVYEVFLSVLQVHGFAAVPTGAVIKIVPEVNAKQGPLPLIQGSLENSGDELITRVIRLDHVPAAQLVPILRPLVPQQGHLAAYAPTNSLIITDHAANISRLLKIISGVDRAESDELEIIQLKYASASELVRILNSLNQTAGKNDPTTLTLASDDRTNSILMTGDRGARLKARTTIMHLDTPLEDGGNTSVIYLKYAKAENLATILTGIQTSSAGTGKSARPVAKTAAAAAAAAARSSSVISDTAIIQADEETNALIITADPNTLRNLKAVIRQLDIRRAQVLIEAIIAEITSTLNKEIGVGMAVDGSQKDSGNVPVGLSNLAGIGEILTGLAAGSAGGGVNVGSGLTLAAGKTLSNGTRYALLLRALASDAATNILSTPSIVTLDNEEAEIVVGQNVPFITGQFTNAATTSTNPFQTIERQDVGLTLKVTPQVNEGDTIKLDLEQETSSVASTSETSGPTTRKRSIKTSVLVDDGAILVLGGLIEESANDTITKIPLLGDIPLLGKLFTSESTSKSKQNLMVFLRPSILRDFHDAAIVTNEKYNYLRQLQQDEKYDDGFGLLDEKPPVMPELPELKPRAEQEPEDDGPIIYDWEGI
ncbi:MAG: type II secretion system secretin GspD [Gammaproteobacteria bacterium]